MCSLSRSICGGGDDVPPAAAAAVVVGDDISGVAPLDGEVDVE